METEQSTEELAENKSVAAARTRLFKTGSPYQKVKRLEIVGIDNVLDRIDDLIDWLRNSEEYAKYGARLEPGILFEGSPGTGKTLSARYMATNSQALFVNVRDWPLPRGQSGIITAVDIADLFHRAREHYAATKQPIIIFWDEFEAYGKDRTAKGMSLRESSVVSQITAELDGIAGKIPGVLFIGCTNYRNAIDAALLRAGRMGVHITFTAPDRKGKEVLLRHYLGKYKTSKEVDCEVASYFFEGGATAADIEETCALTWRYAVERALKANRTNPKALAGEIFAVPVITDQDVSDIFLDKLLGIPPTFSDLTQEDLYRVAVHELGHALVALALDVPIRLITVRPGSDSLGRAILHKPNNLYSTVDEIKNQIAIAVSSIEAEKLAGIPNSAHSEADTGKATQLAAMICEGWGGNSQLPYLNPFGLNERNKYVTGAISDELKARLDESVVVLLQSQVRVSRSALAKFGKPVIEQLADRLVQEKTWTGKQFGKVVKQVVENCNLAQGAKVAPSLTKQLSQA